MGTTESAVAAAFALQRSRLKHTGKDNAKYAATLIRELKGMAQNSHQFRLAHILELAEIEARWLSQNSS